MAYRAPARAADRGTRWPLLIIVVVGVAIVGFRLDRSSATWGNGDRAMPTVTAGAPPPPSPSFEPGRPGPPHRLPRDQQGALGEADGVLPDGVTVFDDEYPAVAKLDPAILGALRRAAADAARDGVTFSIDSGWRSPKYQERLLRAAIAKYGSAKEAARWVATPDTSAHVSGDAVDIGPADATTWLSKRGATYGLCQIYRNEPWHYEVRPQAVDHGCPRMYPDPTYDPKMQQ